MELIQVGEKTYYIKNATNIGVYKQDESSVYLIDSGNDKEAGKKIIKLMEEQGFKIKGIISTHSNADHIGGNKVIQERTGCTIYAHRIEKCFTEYPILEPSYLYGGYPFHELQNKFLLAKESTVTSVEGNLPEGLEYFSLKGHFFDMIGIKTSDDVYFLADALASEETIHKYHIFYLYDVVEYNRTLDFLDTLKGKLYIPSHSPAVESVHDLIEINRKKIMEISNKLEKICEEEKCFEDILKDIFDAYQLVMNVNQYVLVGSTIKSYLSYLYEEKRITYRFQDNRMLWKRV